VRGNVRLKSSVAFFHAASASAFFALASLAAILAAVAALTLCSTEWPGPAEETRGRAVVSDSLPEVE
jgi:hypothetical protein